MLTAAIGTQPRVTETAADIRIEADLPAELTETEHTAVLAALATADHFGHTLTRTAEFVWAEISREATVTTTDSPDAAYRDLVAHTTTCGDCRAGAVCPTAANLVRTWRETRG
ncbi:hypothetical protein [Streptomyces cyaneofuscatus]|uniref:hypothetical protein n=1 Tax=Streptomyces cyaneofuscatus TaxID=66883 RepID=UPI00341B7B69